MGTAESTLNQKFSISRKSWDNARRTNDFVLVDGVSSDTGEPVTCFLHQKKGELVFNTIARGAKVEFD
jgi:hypothetical protein